MATAIKVKSGRAFGPEGGPGYTAIVDADDIVRVWDPIAGYYTTCHALTKAQVAYLRRVSASR